MKYPFTEPKQKYRDRHNRNSFILDSNRHSNNRNLEPKPIALPPPPKGPPIPRPSLELSSIVQAIQNLLHQSKPMVKPNFRFDISPMAAEYNYHLLQAHNFDLDKLLNKIEGDCTTNYGSEFKSATALQPLLGKHPRWHAFANLLKKGSNWKLESIPEHLRKKDLQAALIRGNHKSAGNNLKFIADAFKKEISKGWELMIPARRAMNIPNLVISPLGVAEHIGITSTGAFALKPRLTHDLSFPGMHSETSINSRSIEESLEPCMFGHALSRVIHRIIHLRAKHPNKIIWIRKEDFKSAFRRIHLNANIAFQCAVQLEIEKHHYILLSLRLPFGGSPCPSEFSLVSDVMTDAINDLMIDKSWNPKVVKSPYIEKIPAAKALPHNIKFEPALPTSVPNRESDNCTADVFIDDVITVGVHQNDNIHRLIAGPCTIMHALAHQASTTTFLPRQDLIAEDKNDAEGAPEEIKVVLGWTIDTRRLIIKLPPHKFQAWSTQLTSFITRQHTNAKDIQSLLGRLENIAIIIPMMGHFLNNIRTTEIKASMTGKNQRINNRTKEDLILSQLFLAKAAAGINMNLMTFRSPTRIYINDASEHGLGGFSTAGQGWSWVIPPRLRGRAHINLLEFIAQLVSIWMDILAHRIKEFDCLLGMGDNTASMGWLRRANFRENEEGDLEWYAKQQVARKLATLILNSNTVLYRQWFRGADNDVADSLSRDAYYLTNNSHAQFLTQTIPQQVPTSFKIHPLPNVITSFITSTLLLLPVKQQRLKRQKPSELALSNVGRLSSFKLVSPHSISTVFPSSNAISSCQHSPNPSEKRLSLEEIKQNWWREQSEPPSHMWHRPSGQTTGRTPDWTLTAKSVFCSRNSSEDTGTRMDQN